MSMRPFALLLNALIAVALVGCGNPRHVVAAARVDAPPPGKALINFVYDYGTVKDQAIFNEKKELLFLDAPRTVHQVAVAPGDHDFFIMSPVGGLFNITGIDSMLRIHAAAGRIYDANLDVTFTNYTFARPAHPGTKHHADILKLIASLQPVGPLDRSIPDIRQREQDYGPLIEKTRKALRDHPETKPELEMQSGDSRVP